MAGTAIRLICPNMPCRFVESRSAALRSNPQAGAGAKPRFPPVRMPPKARGSRARANARVKKLLSAYTWAQDSLRTMRFAIMYGFECNGRPELLFGDEPFRAKSGKEVMNRALGGVGKRKNLYTATWKSIAENSRRELAAGQSVP